MIDAASDVVQSAVNVSAALSVNPQLSVPNPSGGTINDLAFPNTSMGNQLRQVARVIKANLTQPALGLNRQIFFCSIGGYDNHQNQGLFNGTQGNLLNQVSQAMATFNYWLVNNTPLAGEPTLGKLSGRAVCPSLQLNRANRWSKLER